MKCVKNEKAREISLDLLRIMAAFAVVFSHVGLKLENAASINAVQTYFMNALVLWHVPCFVMISGRFFLDPNKEITEKKLVKAIKKIVVVFIVWNLIYQVYYINTRVYGNLNLKGIIFNGGALYGPYHFWYLWMLIPLYAIVPFLRKYTMDKKLMEYFIILFIVMETLNKVGSGIPYIGENIPGILEKAEFYFPLGYTGYFVLGYYLYKYPIKGKKEYLLYIIGGILLVGMATLRIIIGDRELLVKPYAYQSPTVIIFSSAIYHFFVHRIDNEKFSEKTEKIIIHFSQLSMGVYLIHLLIVHFIEGTKFYTTDLPELFMRPLRTTIVVMVSLAIIEFIRKIPHIGTQIT